MQALAVGQVRGGTEDECGKHGRVGEWWAPKVSGDWGEREGTADDARVERRHGLAGDELPHPTKPPSQAAGVRSRLGAL